MSLFAWFDSRAVDALVARMVADFVGKVPPTDSARSAGQHAAKLTKTHDQILRQAREFALAQPLSIYQKARLANRFKWAMVDAGYARGFVDEIAYELAAVVARPGAGPTAG